MHAGAAAAPKTLAEPTNMKATETDYSIAGVSVSNLDTQATCRSPGYPPSLGIDMMTSFRLPWHPNHMYLGSSPSSPLFASSKHA